MTITSVARVPWKVLRAELIPGRVVYTVVRSIARSGRSRTVSVMIFTREGPWDITDLVADLLGERLEKNGGIRVMGDPSEAGNWLVYNLSTVLYREGFRCTGRHNCPSDDHLEGERWELDFSFHIHKDGWNALRHQLI